MCLHLLCKRHAFQTDCIISCPQETILNQRILRIYKINSITVLPICQQSRPVHMNIPAAEKRKRPVRCTYKYNIFNFYVFTVAENHASPCMPIQCCQVYYSRTTDSNIFLLICGNKILIICFSCPIIFHQYFICFIRLYRCQNRSRCQHNCLSALQLQRANFVNSRFKIQYFRIFWIINILKFRPENCQRMLIAFIYLNHQIGRLCISKMNFVVLHCCSNM